MKIQKDFIRALKLGLTDDTALEVLKRNIIDNGFKLTPQGVSLFMSLVDDQLDYKTSAFWNTVATRIGNEKLPIETDIGFVKDELNNKESIIL